MSSPTLLRLAPLECSPYLHSPQTISPATARSFLCEVFGIVRVGLNLSSPPHPRLAAVTSSCRHRVCPLRRNPQATLTPTSRCTRRGDLRCNLLRNYSSAYLAASTGMTYPVTASNFSPVCRSTSRLPRSLIPEIHLKETHSHPTDTKSHSRYDHLRWLPELTSVTKYHDPARTNASRTEHITIKLLNPSPNCCLITPTATWTTRLVKSPSTI